MKKILLTAISAVMLSSPAQAIYCGNSIISEGASKADVIKECGQPFYKSPAQRCHEDNCNRAVPSEGNVWYYNQGEGASIKALHFSNDRLYKIEYSQKHGWGNRRY